MRYAMLLLLLAACASGSEYKDSNAKMVIYRPSSYNYRPIPVDINGHKACSLSNDGYFETNEVGLIEASWIDRPGTSRLVPKSKFVRISVNNGNDLIMALGGLLASQATSGGPFYIENVDASTAKRELQGLKRACE